MKSMHSVIALLLIMWGSIAEADDHPDWSALADLLEEPKDSTNVLSFVRAHTLSEAAKGASGSFASPDRAYSLLYRDDRIRTIFLRVAKWPEDYGEKHWKPYLEELPGNLSAKDTRADVIKKLGSPLKSRKNTWLHGDVYIWVIFDEKQERIDEIFVTNRKIEAPK